MTSEPLGQLPLMTGFELDLLHGLLDQELRPLEQIRSTLPIDLAMRRIMLNSLRTAVAETRASIRTVDATSTFTCPKCGRTSHNPNDVEQGYCGNCHVWTRDG